MRDLGVVVLVLGVLWLGIAFALPVDLRGTYNLGMGQRQLTHLFGSSVVTVCGMLMIGFGSVLDHLRKRDRAKG